jgi:hypothetical protein
MRPSTEETNTALAVQVVIDHHPPSADRRPSEFSAKNPLLSKHHQPSASNLFPEIEPAEPLDIDQSAPARCGQRTRSRGEAIAVAAAVILAVSALLWCALSLSRSLPILDENTAGLSSLLFMNLSWFAAARTSYLSVMGRVQQGA